MKIKSFTLIELLVVVAIIGILSSLLLPSLGKAREKSKSTVCKNNQKQISISLFSFLDDNNDYCPVTHNYGNPGSWDDKLSDYDGRSLSDAEKNIVGLSTGNSSVYLCPSDDIVRHDSSKLPMTYSLNLGRNNDNGTWKNYARGITSWNPTDGI